jgi:hypothetical protein
MADPSVNEHRETSLAQNSERALSPSRVTKANSSKSNVVVNMESYCEFIE